MSNRKATHQGECQVCGSVQKLPEGVLSKHGYNVRFGFFEGTCWGAEHKPFEQDISLIESAIARATAQGVEALEGAALLLNDLNPTHVWVSIWNSGNHNVRAHSEWKLLPVGELENNHGTLMYREQSTVTNSPRADVLHRIETYGVYAQDPAERLRLQYQYLNKRYAEERIDRAKQLRSYVSWQAGRTRDWKPKKLKPVELVERKRCPVEIRGTTMSGRPRHCNSPVIPGTNKCERHTDPREALQP